MAEIGSCRKFIAPSFLNWEITGPYQFLLRIISNIVFLQLLNTYLFLKEYFKNLTRSKLFDPPYL